MGHHAQCHVIKPNINSFTVIFCKSGSTPAAALKDLQE